MFPHVAEALEMVRERKCFREAKHALARRTYVRSLVLGEVPPGGAQALADAVEHLELEPTDLAADAACGIASRNHLSELNKLSEEVRAALSAAKSAYPQWSPGCDQDAAEPSIPVLQVAEETLRRAERRSAILRMQHRLSRESAPRLFGDEGRNLSQPALVEGPVVADPKPPGDPNDATDPTDTDDSIDAADIDAAGSIDTTDSPDVVAAVPGISEQHPQPASDAPLKTREW